MKSRVYIFVGLNAIRILSLVGLALVFSSSIVILVNDIHAIQRASSPTVITADNSTIAATDLTMVDCDYLEGSTVPNQPAGAFWAIVNRFLIIFEVIALVFSEFGWPARFFTTFFPVLGPEFGVGALGVFECLIGASVLSHHVGTFPVVTAFFLFSVGCLNILAGLIFRESSRARRSITEWRDRIPDLPRTAADLRSGASSFVSAHAEKAPSAAAVAAGADTFKAGYGFGRQGEKAAGLKGFLISKPLETLPRYAPKPRDSADAGAFASGGQAI